MSGIYDGATDPLPCDDLYGTTIEAAHTAAQVSISKRAEKLACQFAAFLAHPSQGTQP